MYSLFYLQKKHLPICIHIDTLLEAFLAFGLAENEWKCRTRVNTSHTKAAYTDTPDCELKKHSLVLEENRHTIA